MDFDEGQYLLTKQPKEEPPKRSFLDRIFGEGMGSTSKAVAKMLLVIVFVFLSVIAADSVSAWAFGEDTPGNEFSNGLSFVAAMIIARLAWVAKY